MFWSYVAIVLGVCLLIAVVPGLIVEVRQRRRAAMDAEEDRLATGIDEIRRFDTTTDLSLAPEEVTGRHGSPDVSPRTGSYEPLHAAQVPLDSASYAESEARRRSLFTPTTQLERVEMPRKIRSVVVEED